MTVEESIARQQADKKRLTRIVQRTSKPSIEPKAITKADVSAAVCAALAGVARELRFKAKETPGWAAAYHSACAAIEKASDEYKLR